MPRLLASLFLPLLLGGCARELPLVAIAELPTPILSTPRFSAVFGGKDGVTLGDGKCGSVRSLEMIALPGTVFRVHESLRESSADIYRVSTGAYPLPSWDELYIDSRFVRLVNASVPERRPRPRSVARIVRELERAIGARYFWGGNVLDGIPELLRFYPAALTRPDLSLAKQWTMKGVDCSGLLYEATDGLTPRSTEFLVTFGEGVPIRGATALDIWSRLEPLDLIAWNGHVMIVLDKERIIESARDSETCVGGVAVLPALPTMERLLRERHAVDDYWREELPALKRFVVRRWHKQLSSL